ncbi:hypothetical protein TNCV_3053701 [Trichonephila clavipes]|uniref:Uncharacterized protein n=1 Tax=Trichonephila clavipes TaxID=2585209 RepID=A0A8X6RRL3_TRICX|nr:hypothetical protein TNCV_3053701 [Trichonephila clavipes]
MPPQFELRPLILPKKKLDYVQYRASEIIIGAVSSTNSKKGKQECSISPRDNRRDLSPIKFTGKLRYYNTDHISIRVFNCWKRSTRLKRSSTLQPDRDIRKGRNLKHSTLD